MTHPHHDDIVAACREIYDPEIPVNVYDLGLIYDILLNNDTTQINMTLTSPACPVAGEMPEWVAQAVSKVKGVDKVHVELVWEPQWGMDKMTEEAQLELGLI